MILRIFIISLMIVSIVLLTLHVKLARSAESVMKIVRAPLDGTDNLLHSGGRNSGYSVYVDIIFQDDTPLWGQTGKFNTGTHDWEKQEFVIIPPKPIKHLNIYGIFRGHTGEVWFDDFSIRTIRSSGALVFDGIPIQGMKIPPTPFRRGGEISIPRGTEKESETQMIEVSTQNGLSMQYDWKHGLIDSFAVDERELAQRDTPSGFLVRDVRTDSDFYAFQDGSCPELNLQLNSEIISAKDHIQIKGKIIDMTGADRAITLIFALPIDAVSWQWHDDIRHQRAIQRGVEYINAVNINTGTNGMMSLYPFANINDGKTGLAMALDMDMPAQYRIAYNADTKQFFIAYDFGLTRDTDNFSSAAPFQFVIYRTDPQWGFRSAAKKLYDIFPEHFICRDKNQGIWMPFTDVSTVEGWEDFGFRYHEGINNIPFDDEAGILSFRYTEPSTWWMRMPPDVPRTDENIMRYLHESAQSDNPRHRAKAIITSGSFDEHGRYQYQVRDTPWCNGAVFSSNPNPYIPGNSEAKMNWNEEIKQQLYGLDAKGEAVHEVTAERSEQDGEYLDSLEGYVTADENFRREHFHYVTVPLTFSTSSKKPVIHKAFSVYEFAKWIAEDVHAMGKLMFANSVPHRFAFLCPHFDVMGTEMNWLRDGKWNPASDEWMNFKRTMCYQKPYLFLMNTNYDQFTPDLVEKYFQRSLFYGMFPSMFSHNAADDPYWRAPKWYNRDRHLFKRYIPLVKMVAAAGWEPVTYAVSDNPKVYIERFGPDAEGNIYFTLLNDSGDTQQTEVTIMFASLNRSEKLDIKYAKEMHDLISGEKLEFASKNGQMIIELVIEPEDMKVVKTAKQVNH
ncbi:TPA: hypothetical protein EYP66_20330 [Candidatus Poribacteria bacterium]|nr:hypothetical protein [Candidatus Poribacteria bacterium]